MPRQPYSNFPDIAQEKSRANIEQKDKIVRNRISLNRKPLIMPVELYAIFQIANSSGSLASYWNMLNSVSPNSLI